MQAVIVELLLDMGANVFLKAEYLTEGFEEDCEYFSYTARELASKNGHSSIAALLMTAEEAAIHEEAVDWNRKQRKEFLCFVAAVSRLAVPSKTANKIPLFSPTKKGKAWVMHISSFLSGKVQRSHHSPRHDHSYKKYCSYCWYCT